MTTDHETANTLAALATAEPDVVVVGGGLAGLIAANRVADAGHSVVMVERARLGGRASTDERDGFHMNRGPHAIYIDGELSGALAGLGISPETVKIAGPNWCASLAGARTPLPAGPLSLLRSGALQRRSKVQVPAVLRRMAKAEPAALANTTTDAWIGSLTDAEDLRAYLHALVRLSTYSAASDLASADAVAKQMHRALGSGARYVANGWQQIVDSLDTRAQRAGVKRVHAEVDRVVASDAGVTVVMSDDALTARAVVVAAGLPAVADRLVGTDEFTEAAGPPVEATVLDLGVARPPTASLLLGIDEPLYLSVHSIAPGMAPEGHTNVAVARYLRPSEPLDPSAARAGLLAHANRAGIAVEDIEMERFLLRMTVTGGMPVAAAGGLPARPSVASAERPGIFVAGDWVGDVGLLADASAASAIIAADAAVRHAKPGMGSSRPMRANGRPR